MLLYHDLRKEYECIHNKRSTSLRIVQEKEEGWTDKVEVELMILFLQNKCLPEIICIFVDRFPECR